MSSPSADRPDRSYTLEEYEALPDDPNCRDELSNGRLVREPRPGARHGRIAMKIAGLLGEFVRKHDLGSVEIACGYVLSQQPLIARGPDVSFISKLRLPAEVPVRAWFGY